MGIGDNECADLLRWAAPRLGLDDCGFTRVRGQVRKRIGRRIQELGLRDSAAYRLLLERDAGEWIVLDRLCRVTISRFWRDRPAFDLLAERILPDLIDRARQRGTTSLRIWSLACASGEEPYSIALAWHLRLARTCPELSLDLIASDASAHMVARAEAAEYPASIFHELPADLRVPLGVASRANALVRIPPDLRAGVSLRELDVRTEAPAGPFDLILCRNLVFTYFAPDLRLSLLARFHQLLAPGGALMIGNRESLPDDQGCYDYVCRGIYLVRNPD